MLTPLKLRLHASTITKLNLKLNMKWNNSVLQYILDPVYLGITLDRILSYKAHMDKLKKKIVSRNNLLQILGNSAWGADYNTSKQTAVALCYSTAEYCAPLWSRSSQTKIIDSKLNKACRIITGTLQPTPLNNLYYLATIAPPRIRRNCTT